MIYETKEISSELLSGLKPNNYTRRIKSHFAAYGTGYDFLHFYAVEESGKKLGIISVFNASMMISTFKDKRFDDKVHSYEQACCSGVRGGVFRQACRTH